MKAIPFLIFFSIFLVVYGLVNYYILLRGWQALPKSPLLRGSYLCLSLFAVLAFIAGRLVERFSIGAFSDILIWVGSFWLGIMTCLLVSIVIIDILRVINHFFNFFPSFIHINYEKTKLVTALIVVLTTLIVVTAGYINAQIPVVRHVELTIPKKAGDLNSLKIALASDIHLGTIVSNSRIEKMVTMINQLEPDIVLLAGDIVDEDLKPVIANNLGDALAQLTSKYGTYAITGNHEFIGGVNASVKYLIDHHITMLRDQFVKVEDKFYIVGRDDRSIHQFTTNERKPLEDIMAGMDCNLPIILMDHQPFSLHKVAEHCVDLQVSGHTHHGQLWPFNYITSMIYEISHGYARIGDTHFYISAGYGTWGPPIRTSTRPEIVEIILHFIRP